MYAPKVVLIESIQVTAIHAFSLNSYQQINDY